MREGITSTERDRITDLERENKELRRANEILRVARCSVERLMKQLGLQCARRARFSPAQQDSAQNKDGHPQSFNQQQHKRSPAGTGQLNE